MPMSEPAASARRDPTTFVIPASPWLGLRDHLLACASDLEAAGDATRAEALRAAVDAWWAEQQHWNGNLSAAIGLHHEISNALVGVSGNVQILLMGPLGQRSDVRERLEVVLRESHRIRDAAAQLGQIRAGLRDATSAEGGGNTKRQAVA